MGEKRELRKDLPERQFDSDLNSPALSNIEDEAVDQRDSDGRGGQQGDGKKGERPENEKHDKGSADNLTR